MKRRRFEYNFTSCNVAEYTLVTELNKMGAEGWELISITNNVLDRPWDYSMTWKREIFDDR